MNQLDQDNPLSVWQARWQMVVLPGTGIVCTHLGYLQTLPITGVDYGINYFGTYMRVKFGITTDGITPMYNSVIRVQCVLKLSPMM